MQSARLEIVWSENGDFSLHYHEEHEDGAFDYRWDRHPSDHKDDLPFYDPDKHETMSEEELVEMYQAWVDYRENFNS